MRTLSTGGVVALLLLVVAAPTALGQPAGETPADTAAARSLFQEGLQLADQEQWQEAADRFRRSLSLRPSPVVSYNLASALGRIGGLVEASELLRAVVRDEQADPGAREAAQALLETITPRIATLTLTIDGDPDTVELRLDDEPFRVEAVGVAVPVDPGTHTVVAMRGGEPVGETRFEVAEAASVTASLTIPPPPAAGPDLEDADWEPSWEPLPEPVAPEPEATATPTAVRPAAEPRRAEPVDDSSWWESPLFWTGVGVGAAALAAAVVVIAVVAGGGEATPIQGSLDPRVLELGR